MVSYDVVVVLWMGNVFMDIFEGSGFLVWIGVIWDKVVVFWYGENLY